MPVGEYFKAKYIKNYLEKRCPLNDYSDYIDDEDKLRIPKIKYDYGVNSVNPVNPVNPVNSHFSDSNYSIARNTNSNFKLLNSATGLSTNIPSIPTYMKDFGLINSVPETISSIGKIAGPIGKATTLIGGGLSGINLGLYIAYAVQDKKVDFDNAMNIADDATGIVSSALSMIPGVGVPLSLAASIGEKVITGAIKAIKAVKDEKAKNISGENWIDKSGQKHLKASVLFDNTTRANFPSWMVDDIGTQIKDYKKNKPIREAKKKQEKADYKSLSKNEKLKNSFLVDL
jgi:hypothetical protein